MTSLSVPDAAAQGSSRTGRYAYPPSDDEPDCCLGDDAELTALLDESLQTAVAVADTDMGLLSLCDASGQALRVGASVGLDAPFLGTICFERRQRVVVEDTDTDPLFAAYREAARAAGFRAVHSIPLVTRTGRIIGILSTHWRAPHRPGEREIRLMDLCGRQAADAIENARLYRLAREEMARRQEIVEELRASEQCQRQLADNLPAGFIYQIRAAVDGSRRFTYVSGGIETVCGVTPAETEADPLCLYGLIAAEDQARVQAAEDEAARNGTRFVCRFRTHTRHGTVRWLHCRSAPSRLADGTVIWDGVAIDITEHQRAEEAQRFLAEVGAVLATSLDFQTTLTSVARLCVPRLADWCAVDVLEPGGTLQRLAVAHVDAAKVQWADELNRRYPPDPRAEHGVYQVIRAGQPVLFSEVTEACLASAASDPEHLRLLRSLGMTSAMIVPLRARGHTLGAVSLVAAESRRRFGPSELALAVEVGHRAGLAADNARLYGTVVDADRRKDEFLAMLAHELRNPLAPIRNALQILRTPNAPPETQVHARTLAERQVGLMARLVDDLLDVSRVTRGKIVLKKEPIDLATVLNRAAETTLPAIHAHRHELKMALPSEPVPLVADPARLEQVFVNLLTNAAKYTPPGGTITLSTAGDTATAEVHVRDTGVGIAPALLPRVFDLFVQAEQGPDRTQGGLGIGLTLVKSLVEMHGGRVEAHSAGPGHGSEFIVRLPRAAAVVPCAANAEPTPKPSACSRRVLVVDDNRDAAESLAVLLRLLGHEVQTAHDGKSALAAAERFGPEVVLLDIGLPVMDGYAVARQMRAQSNGPAPLLVAVTGYGQEEDRRAAADAGFDHHLVKPPDPDALQRLLAR